MDKKLITVDTKWGIAKYEDYQLVVFDVNADEIHGSLFFKGKRVSECGWWRTSDVKEALEKAIKYYQNGLLENIN